MKLLLVNENVMEIFLPFFQFEFFVGELSCLLTFSVPARFPLV